MRVKRSVVFLTTYQQREKPNYFRILSAASRYGSLLALVSYIQCTSFPRGCSVKESDGDVVKSIYGKYAIGVSHIPRVLQALLAKLISQYGPASVHPLTPVAVMFLTCGSVEIFQSGARGYTTTRRKRDDSCNSL